MYYMFMKGVLSVCDKHILYLQDIYSDIWFPWLKLGSLFHTAMAQESIAYDWKLSWNDDYVLIMLFLFFLFHWNGHISFFKGERI